MKKGLLLSVVTSALVMAAHPVGDAGHALDGSHVSKIASASEAGTTVATGSFGEALKSGKFTAKTRLFYMNRSFDKPNTPDAVALTAGGIFKYESGDYHGLKFAFAYYGSHRVGDFYTREEGIGTSLLGRDGKDLAFLGEAYLQYDIKIQW